MNRSLLLFSGGQDSTVCLLWACQNFNNVETIGFNYGQRHSVELDCRLELIKSLKRDFIGINDILGKDHVVNLQSLGDISETSLTRETEIMFEESGLPSTFVPARNLLFLVIWDQGIKFNIYKL